MSNAGFYSDGFGTTGEIRWTGDIADSGNRMRRGFCPACGTPLFTAAESRPHLIFARLGSFDDLEAIAPQATIWAASAPSWAQIDPALPRIEGQPPPVA
jgi:hypothetical protein